MKKVCIAASRDGGFQCASWPRENTPAGFELTEEMSAADIIICVIYYRDKRVFDREGRYRTLTIYKRRRARFYYKKDLQKAKNLTRFVKAFYFPNKESGYYINDKAEKIYLNFKED